jgi:hypothetical protein
LVLSCAHNFHAVLQFPDCDSAKMQVGVLNGVQPGQDATKRAGAQYGDDIGIQNKQGRFQSRFGAGRP